MNWCEADDNDVCKGNAPRRLHAEGIPCVYDDVVFPLDLQFVVDIDSGADIRVNTVRIGQQVWHSFVHSFLVITHTQKVKKSKKERLECPQMTRSLRRHYKSCGKCHGNERLKRKAFRRLRKNRHRRCGRHVMMGQTVPCTNSSNRKGPVANCGQPCATDIQRQWGRGTGASPGPEISRVVSSSSARYGGAVSPVQTLVHENSKLKLDPLRCSQSVQLVEERSDVVVPRRGEQQGTSNYSTKVNSLPLTATGGLQISHMDSEHSIHYRPACLLYTKAHFNFQGKEIRLVKKTIYLRY